MPTKDILYKEFADQGLMVLAVSFQESADLVREFQQEFQLSFPVLLDPEGQISQSYRIRGHPVTFLIDRQRFLVGQVLGERDWSSPEAKMLITTLLQEHP